MGVYVQQTIEQVPLSFSGIWATPQHVDADLVKSNEVVTLSIPRVIVVQSSLGFITAQLPGDLRPKIQVNGVFTGVDSSEINVVVNIGIDGVISVSKNPDLPFSGAGSGGFDEIVMTYQLANGTS